MSQEELNSEMLEAAKKGDFDKIWELIEQGADVNARTKGGRTVLWFAALWGHLTPELLETLVSRGANINARDKDGMTALMLSAYNRHLTPELLQVFISNGADVNARNEYGDTALICSARKGHLTQELARAFVEQFIRLDTPLEEIQKQLPASKETPAILVPVFIDKFETEPWIVVDFMKKHVGKKLQEWVDNNVEGANILVSRLSHQIRQKEFMSEGSGTQNMDFF